MVYTMYMLEIESSGDKKIEHPLESFPIRLEGLASLETFEIKKVKCTCGKCGASLTGEILVENIGEGCFRPVSPEYGGMDLSMTTHHTDTNDSFGDGEHHLFLITGEITGFAFVTGQGCGVIKPMR